jgi:hypothetical protein
MEQIRDKMKFPQNVKATLVYKNSLKSGEHF